MLTHTYIHAERQYKAPLLHVLLFLARTSYALKVRVHPHEPGPFPAFAARLNNFLCSRLTHRREPPLATAIDVKSASSTRSTASVFVILETVIPFVYTSSSAYNSSSRPLM